jgi:putative ABC transport system substrate-binding protein
MTSRRAFIALSGAAVLTWPGGARLQPAPTRRLGVLMSLGETDKESQVRLAAFLRALQDFGWTADQNLQIDTRWGGNRPDTLHRLAAEMVALAPDVILASGSAAATPLHNMTRSVPIVFVQVAEPLGGHLIESFAHPGGNVTGIASIEYGMSARWLQLLKEIAPAVTRAVVVSDPDSNAGKAQFRVIQAVAPSLGVELQPVGVRDAAAIEHAITTLAEQPHGGLLVTTSTRASAHRALMIALAARHRLPAVYPFRFYAASGGLVSYGADWIDQYRRAAGYVDRILKGEKPADLPVQAPTKYELVVNLKTAKALGLDIPATVLARADEVIE